jgi:NAD(P)-dependent dehydrogenase (short-subunit alcohol dehydrogenase family)
MTSLNIEEADIPVLTGKVALVTGKLFTNSAETLCSNGRYTNYLTGGSSGIGFAAAEILARKGAKVHILDIHPPSSSRSISPVCGPLPERVSFHQCDITDWRALRNLFVEVGHIDYVFANAGIPESEDFLSDVLEVRREDNGDSMADSILGCLKEPAYPLMGVNLKGVLNTIKLAHHTFRRYGAKGSIVITSSATAYAPEQSLPVYSALKLALIGLVRSLRHNLVQDNITINAVVPACTETALVGSGFLGPIKKMGLPVSTAHHVGLALVYSAVAWETRKVDVYGKEPIEDIHKHGRWNGRVLLTLGHSFTELEEKLADLQPLWFGKENAILTRRQQAVTDFRRIKTEAH